MALYQELHTNENNGEKNFSFELKSNFNMVCTFLPKNSNEENRYVIADTEGNVIRKGTFIKEIELKLNDVPKGNYELVLFNSTDRESFNFKISTPV